jgi:hypothetical protein
MMVHRAGGFSSAGAVDTVDFVDRVDEVDRLFFSRTAKIA